eukprot:584527-Rhodomonas_salina.1
MIPDGEAAPGPAAGGRAGGGGGNSQGTLTAGVAGITLAVEEDTEGAGEVGVGGGSGWTPTAHALVSLPSLRGGMTENDPS